VPVPERPKPKKEPHVERSYDSDTDVTPDRGLHYLSAAKATHIAVGIGLTGQYSSKMPISTRATQPAWRIQKYSNL
jgi:hypothetical protein